MARNLVGMKYKDMPQKYRDNNTREDFKNARQAQKQAAKEKAQAATAKANQATKDRREIKRQTAEDKNITNEGKFGYGVKKSDMTAEDQKTFDTAGQVIYGVEDINDYDFAMGGIGSLKGKNIASKADIKGLMNYGGFTAEQIQDRITASGADVKDGAQAFLAKKLNEVNTPEEPIPDQPSDTNPEETPNQMPPVEQIIINNPPPAQEPTPEPTLGVSPETPDPQEFKDEEMQKIIDNNGNNNIEDVSVDQENTQKQKTELDNDINLNLAGNNNDTEVIQDNTVTNTGGDQANSSAVTNSPQSEAQELRNSYTDNIMRTMDFRDANNNGIDDRDENGSGMSPTRQDLTNPDTFNNFQQVESQQDNVQKQITTMDNDINANIAGNNNLTNINQDNSVRNYGGDQRNFTYVSNSSNPYTDTPASMSTLAGFNSVSDSPGSNAAFVNQYQTLNSDAQKKNDNVGMAADMINRANSVSPIDTNKFEDSILQRIQDSRNRGTVGFTRAFGDLGNFPSLDWQPSPAREPLPDFDAEEQYNAFT